MTERVKTAVPRAPLVAALLLRVALPLIVLGVTGGDSTRFVTPDTHTYLTPARHLMERGAFDGLTGPEIFRTPGYPLVLTLGLVAGHPFIVTLLLQALGGTLTVWCIMRTASLLFRDDARAAPEDARIVNRCGWLAACEPLALACGAMMMADALLATAMSGVVLLVVMYVRQPSPRTALAIGATLAAAAYIKPIAYYLPALLIPWLWLAQRRSQAAPSLPRRAGGASGRWRRLSFGLRSVQPAPGPATLSTHREVTPTTTREAIPSTNHEAMPSTNREAIQSTNRERRTASSPSIDFESPYQGDSNHSPPLLWERGQGGVGTSGVLLIAAAVAILVGPWQVRNGIQTGFWGFSTLTARAVYIAAGGGVTAARDGRAFGDIRNERIEQAAIRTSGEPAHIGDMYRRGLGDVLGSPVTALTVHVKGMLLTLFDPGSLDYLRLFGAYPATSPVTRLGGQGLAATVATIARTYPAVLWCSLLLEAILLGYLTLAARGAWRALRSGGAAREARVLLLIAAYFLLLSGGIFGTARFRLPIMPVMILLAGYALSARPVGYTDRA